MTPGCPERIDKEFWLWAWRWRNGSRQRKIESLNRIDRDRIAWLRSRADVARFLRRLPF
ncbi:MAG: hypothetical protein ABR552_08175 [Actinomycetota bacterium]